jgi:hypothetical protein
MLSMGLIVSFAFMGMVASFPSVAGENVGDEAPSPVDPGIAISGAGRKRGSGG